VPILFALLAAFSNALNVVTQHVASIGDPQRSKGWRFVRYLVANPLWLFGWVALAGAFVFQAIALHNGQMSVVQPLLVTELVFALVLRWVWRHQTIRAVTWWAAAVTCVALAIFLAVSEPTGGNTVPTSDAWVAATATVGGLAALLALAGWGWKGSPGRRAALLGAAASTLWALVAAFIKATTDTLSQFGFAGMFAHWQVYALAVSGLVAELLNQAALHVGPLSMSQPFIVVVDPIVSIALSVWVFAETFSESVPRLAVGSAAFAVMCVALAVLARTAPATMDPDSQAVGEGDAAATSRRRERD
jgi:drug/metabolite transporter (DMT)-like permease